MLGSKILAYMIEKIGKSLKPVRQFISTAYDIIQDSRMFGRAILDASAHGDGVVVITPEGGKPLVYHISEGTGMALKDVQPGVQIDVQVRDPWGHIKYHRTKRWS